MAGIPTITKISASENGKKDDINEVTYLVNAHTVSVQNSAKVSENMLIENNIADKMKTKIQTLKYVFDLDVTEYLFS